MTAKRGRARKSDSPSPPTKVDSVTMDDGTGYEPSLLWDKAKNQGLPQVFGRPIRWRREGRTYVAELAEV
ncbi:hypothetical protein [Acrocarpospora phusangensis]|uniref:hypothetical protein n=1 Tax=Acrocarpospora phusangensis TaxID=1070424 RepID=UPI001950A584|nr:hypothetical protein [Acrocarpospora phusangensis]